LLNKYDDIFESFSDLSLQKDKFSAMQKYKNTIYLLNPFFSNNEDDLNSLYLISEEAPAEHDILTAHLFKGSRNLSTFTQVADREKEFVDSLFIFRAKFIKKIYLKKMFAIQYKTDLAYNDYILKSYINTGVYFNNDYEFFMFISSLKTRFFDNNRLYYYLDLIKDIKRIRIARKAKRVRMYKNRFQL
jgi:hypothetical protein